MFTYLLPVVYALFIWWFSTGLIIYLDGLPGNTFRYTFGGTTALLIIGLVGLFVTRNDTSVMGAYLAFTFGTLAWGWQEVSFYLGYVTGPRKEPCPESCGGIRHFGHAIQTSLYHELAIIGFAVLVLALTWGGANQVGTWTFFIMWWMHQSAKLNVFFGVRNLNEEFLPEKLQFLRSFLKKRGMNSFFPISVTVSTIITVLLFQRAFAPDATEFTQVSYTFLAFLMALAILEHWFLVMPLPGTLWDWGLRSRKQIHPAEVEVVAGFLGAGKTTFLRKLLNDADPDVRTMVMVNDFGSVGIDGSLVSGRGADVIELPNGCICCSLRGDLARQVRDIVTKYSPQRLLIEPSGVAEVTELLRVLARPTLADIIKSVKVYTLVDAGSFLRDYASLPHYFETQTAIAPLLIVNKTDLATPAELQTIEQTLQVLNPAARVIPAQYGRVLDSTLLGEASIARDALPTEGDEDEEHDHAHVEALGLESAVLQVPGVYEEQALRRLLDAVANGQFGGVLRMKGMLKVRGGWVAFDMAGHRGSLVAFAPKENEEPRAIAIGNDYDAARLQAAFDDCKLAPMPSAVMATAAVGD